MKRLFDIISSIVVVLLGFPFFIIITVLILIDGKGGVFYKQERIGRNKKPFYVLKFRTMRPGSENLGQLTIGSKDNRITTIGYYLRKYKLDEFPQLINVILGDMSIVGPRPEVVKYVNLYTEEQLSVLKVRPGLTDYASIIYFKENELLGNAEDPEKVYIQEIMPQKLALNTKYIKERGMLKDLKIIFKTFLKIVS
ncbi:MAG: sugar transferase [Flavobacteriales bacterium]|jgi:lipopolysaccharide/colanic/teichoic acid biosynthesis glycosyltransferase|nr:sugar transferase [Flavobacteriales bacterium]